MLAILLLFLFHNSLLFFFFFFNKQVALNSPVKRKVSPTASSSSEENDTSLNSANKSDVVIDAQQPPSYNEISSEGVPKNVRSQSIKIDTSYFTKSPTSESFDQGQQEVSVIDDVDQPGNKCCVNW